MRFCPFCSAENADELPSCQACGRRLPPLPPRRARNAPPTGVQLPPRAGATLPPRRSDASQVMSRSDASQLVVRSDASAILAAPAPSSQPMAAVPPPLPPAAPTPPSVTVPAVAPPLPVAPLPVAPSLPVAPLLPVAPPLPPTTPPPAIPRVSRPSRPPPVTAPTPTPTLFPNASTLPTTTGSFAATEATDVQAPPINADSSALLDAPTRSYPARAPSPGAHELDDADSATKLNAIGRKIASPSATTNVPAAPPHTPPPIELHSPLRGAARAGEAGAIGARLPLQAGASVVTPTPTPIDGTPADTQPTMAPHLVPVPSMPPMPQIVPAAPPSIAAPVMPMPIAPIVPIGRPHSATDTDPPPTRIQRPEQHAERPFTPPKVLPVPEVPEPGLLASARYAYWFARARYQRRGAIRVLGIEIKQDTEALDHVLGALGREARRAGVEGRVFSAENAAIAGAEQRVLALHREHTEVDARKAEEGSRFVDIERDRNAKLAEAERTVEEAQRELTTLDNQRRTLRDKRKEIERRQKAYLKAAEDANRQAGAAQMGDQRSELRRVSESHSVEAAALEPERQELDRKISALDRPFTEATAKLDAAKAELDAAKRSLNDAREGHTHRLAELDSEHKRKAREIALAEGEIARRLVTLGTLVNLNRIEDPSFAELYQRIDRIRGAITARTTEIERLAAERDAYDRGALVRGVVVIGAAVVAFIALVVILRAIL